MLLRKRPRGSITGTSTSAKHFVSKSKRLLQKKKNSKFTELERQLEMERKRSEALEQQQKLLLINSQQPRRRDKHKFKTKLRPPAALRFGARINYMACHWQLLFVFLCAGLVGALLFDYDDATKANIAHVASYVIGDQKIFALGPDLRVTARHEQQFMPHLRIVDAEVHVWNPLIMPRKGSIWLNLLSWMRRDFREGTVTALAFTPQLQQTLGRTDSVLSPYEITELVNDVGANNVVAVVAVESWWGFPKGASPTHELEWMAALSYRETAAKTSNENRSENVGRERNGKGLIQALVPFVDMKDSAHVSGEIEAAGTAIRARVRSVRYPCAFAEGMAHPWRLGGALSPTESMTRSWRDVLNTVLEYDLAFEAFFYHPQLGQVEDLARSFPEMQIIVNHAGGPLQCGEGTKALMNCAGLTDSIARLALLPNVMIKLSGFGLPSTGLGYHERTHRPNSDEIAQDIGEYCRFVIDHFGASRVMFASNFPYDKVSFDYVVIWNAYKKIIVSHYNARQQQQLLYATAATLYLDE